MTVEWQPTAPGGSAEGEAWGPQAPPNLLTDESTADYEAIRARITRTVKPTDALEEFWVRDVVDLLWEAQRLRRMKAQMMKGAAQRGLERALKPVILGDVQPGEDSRHLPREEELAARFAAGEPQAVERAHKLLELIGLTPQQVTTQAVANRMDEIDHFNRMIATVDRERINILREIQRYRRVLAEDLWRVVGEMANGGGDMRSQGGHTGSGVAS
jgi:hypothetical protein